MSITQEQSNCIHDLDDTFRCTKCGLYDSFAAQASEFSFNQDCFLDKDDEPIEYIYYMCSNSDCPLIQEEIKLPSCYNKPQCVDCNNELDLYE